VLSRCSRVVHPALSELLSVRRSAYANGAAIAAEIDREQGKVPPDDGAGRRREAPMSFRELTLIDVREVLRNRLADRVLVAG
jgi:hypothetical protein